LENQSSFGGYQLSFNRVWLKRNFDG